MTQAQQAGFLYHRPVHETEPGVIQAQQAVILYHRPVHETEPGVTQAQQAGILYHRPVHETEPGVAECLCFHQAVVDAIIQKFVSAEVVESC